MLSTLISLVGGAASTLSPSAASIGANNDPFSGLLLDAIGNVNALQQKASSTVEGLLRGDGIDIHQAMIATQRADTAFELALSVRNKAVGAYQQMMNMQF